MIIDVEELASLTRMVRIKTYGRMMDDNVNRASKVGLGSYPTFVVHACYLFRLVHPGVSSYVCS
jgi:hypothetical protein